MLDRFMRARTGRREADAALRRQQSVRYAALYRKAWGTKDSEGHPLKGVQQFDTTVLSPVGGRMRKYHDEGRGHVPDADLDELEIQVDAFVARGAL
jgi:hypothetical protein